VVLLGRRPRGRRHRRWKPRRDRVRIHDSAPAPAPACPRCSESWDLPCGCLQTYHKCTRLSAQWGKDSSGGIGPPNAGMAQLGNIPAGTKVLLGFNEPNHVRRQGLSGPALGPAQPAGLSFKARTPLPPWTEAGPSRRRASSPTWTPRPRPASGNRWSRCWPCLRQVKYNTGC